MLFSSITFLYYFLPAVLILYFAVPNSLKNGVLFLSGLFFYAWGEPKYVFLMLFSIGVSYVLAILMERFRKYAKVFLTLAAVIGLGMLGYFKYADFFLENLNAIAGTDFPLLKIVLPIGISFYTFQLLSYVVDVYREEVPAQKNFIALGAYAVMFPQLIAGPIVRYSEINAQLSERKHTLKDAAEGTRRFLIGLGKKVLIANALGELCGDYLASQDLSVMFSWLYAIGFALQIYFDFSGYSDMAIGLGRIFGFRFSENFRYPYISRSITEFWRRWHISLGSWFRDYVYIPLGGSRAGKVRSFFNLFLVWMLTGLWHGASWNFVLWGLFFALLLIPEKLFYGKYLEKNRVLGHVYVLFCVVISFVIFNGAGFSGALTDLMRMFGGGGLPGVSREAIYALRSYGTILLLACLGATPLPKKLAELLSAKIGSRFVWLEILAGAAMLLMVTANLVDGSFNPFLYFRF